MYKYIKSLLVWAILINNIKYLIDNSDFTIINRVFIKLKERKSKDYKILIIKYNLLITWIYLLNI